MAKIDNISKTLGSVAAVMTMLERYPVLLKNIITGFDTSLGFMLNVLKIIGVNEMQIVEWLAEKLSGDGADGALEGLEYAVKAVLIANVKNLFTCSINPIIPNRLMENYKDPSTGGWVDIGGEGFEINLDTVDMYGILSNCPSNKDGSVFYFDAYDSDYCRDGDSEADRKRPSLTPSELWMSRDFNAFLWYVINKGSEGNEGEYKLYWDNRVRYFKQFRDKPQNKERFFREAVEPAGSGSIPVEDEIVKRRIIKCRYYEQPDKSVMTNVLRVYINPHRYHDKRTVRLKILNEKDRLFTVNKTVFEFNYDYVMSLKLFNSKTLVANIFNAVLGVSTNLSLDYSIDREVIASQVGNIVKKIIIEDDTQTTDCHFTFSNDEYERMMEDAVRKHDGTYRYGDRQIPVDYQEIIDSVNEISAAADMQSRTEAIRNAFTNVAATMARDGEVNETDSLSFGFEIITKLINETVTQIVMQVLSPKVMILYRINAELMGNLDPKDESWQYFMKNMENLVVSLVKEIKDMIIEQLMAWLMEQLKPLLEIFTSRILLEKIRYYRDLIEQLISAYKQFGSLLGKLNGLLADLSGDTDLMQYAIDNVNYADIVPEKKSPKKEC